jgi:serine/threonine protein kinase
LRYRVLRPLGPTRFGHAHLALLRDRGLKDEGKSRGFFALELLREDWAQDEDLRALFLDEAAQTLHLEHPNVVRTQEVLALPEICGRVTRWFAGQTLACVLERVGRAQFPLHLHVRVLCEVLAAVQYLHDLEQDAGPGARQVYRDTSPEHVLVTYTGQIKIVGAGFERTIDEIERRSGVLFSDTDYASPELCLGYPAAPSADVYSVGVMLWEALARARRVFADTPEASARMRINGEEPDVEQFRRGVPERLAQICRRSLAVSPRDRYASAQELQIDLESFLADTETDAQQNAGLGALAELMGQHFADERADMLSFIEQQLAEPHAVSQASSQEMSPQGPPSSKPASSRAALVPAVVTSSGVVAASSVAASSVAGTTSVLPPPALRSTRSRLEVLPPHLQPEPEELELLEDATELLPTLEPARWDDQTHNVTSFEELGPVESELLLAGSDVLDELASDPGASDPGASDPGASDPRARDLAASEAVLSQTPLPMSQSAAAQSAAAQSEGAQLAAEPAAPAERGVPPRFLQLPVREPDTSGHRAYSSTLQPPAPPPPTRGLARTLAPVGLVAAVVLLFGYGVRVARSSGSDEAALVRAPASAAQAPGERTAAATVNSTALPLQAVPAVVEAVEIVHPSELAEASPVLPSPTEVGAAPAQAQGEAIGEGIVEVSLPSVPATEVVVATGSPAQPVVSEAVSEEAAPEAAEDAASDTPTLIVEELLNGEEARHRPRARRSRAKAADGRALRPSGPQPRAIDETDPYLD